MRVFVFATQTPDGTMTVMCHGSIVGTARVEGPGGIDFPSPLIRLDTDEHGEHLLPGFCTAYVEEAMEVRHNAVFDAQDKRLCRTLYDMLVYCRSMN